MSGGVVRILVFSSLRELIGEAALSVPVSEAPTAGAALEWVAHRHPGVADYLPFVRTAVNRRYAARDTELSGGDEVALITPVSGG